MYLSVDIGGTKTLIALFSRHGRVIRRYKFQTADTLEKFTQDLRYGLLQFTKYDVISVTVAVPGIVQKNCSITLGNRDWGVFSLMDEVRSVFSCPIYFENDANLATIFESYGLKGRTVFLTFSTGVGGGVADDGVLLPESGAFEPGHIFYTYNGITAEWEDIAAASALEKAYEMKPITDVRGVNFMQDIARRVYLGIPDIIETYEPDSIILGGPLGKIFKYYVKFLPKTDAKYRQPKRPLDSVIYGCYLYSKLMEQAEE